MPEPSFSVRLYRRLLALYPAGFRENYAGPLEREFRDELQEATGAGALARLWLRMAVDLATSVPAQFAREAWQDSRHALRLWARRPWHTGFAILALAVGIGANTGVFSVVNALLLRSLPFRDPARLAALNNFGAPHESAAQFHTWRTQSTYLADAALMEQFDVNLGGAGDVRRAHAVQVSSNFFSLLGTQPILGRGFAPGDDVDGSGWAMPGRNAVAVIGYDLWHVLYGGDPKALGATIRINGAPHIVIGVAPPGFDYPARAVLWKPAAFSRGNNGWETIGRLKPGVTWKQARQAFAVEADRLCPTCSAYVKAHFPSRMLELRDQLAGPARRASLALMACVVLILLIACTNVANLLMARTADRAAELAIRSALGASRARLMQQLLTESVLLSLAAAAAGLLLAVWTTSIAAGLQTTPLAAQSYGILDGRVLAFALAVSVASGLLFGLLPARYAGRIHTSRTTSSSRARAVLVAGQVALTIVLLSASLSVGRAFLRLVRADRGLLPQGLITVNVSLEGTAHQGAGRDFAYFQEVLAHVRRLPGVRSASATEFLPLYSRGFRGGPFDIDGQPGRARGSIVPVFPDYFQTMGARMLAGRDFTAAEVQGNTKVAVVTERVAALFGSPALALGHRVSHWTVIGVVRTMDYMQPDMIEANANLLFLPSSQPGGFYSTFVARVDGRAEDSLARVRDAIRSVDPQVPLFGVKTMEQRMDEALARPRFCRTAVLCFGGFALLLAVTGICGMVSYAVARRTREMGVRMALGTTPAHLRAGLLRQSLVTIAAGAVPGIAAAVLSGRLLASLVEGAEAFNVAAYAASVLLITAVAAAGVWAATRPIARLNIAEILRAE